MAGYNGRMTVSERRRRAAKKKRRKTMIRLGAVILFLTVLLAGVTAATVVIKNGTKKQIVIEAGGTVSVTDFLKSEPKNAYFVTDIGRLDLTVPGDYPVRFCNRGKEHTATLCVRDTTAPTADAVPVKTAGGVVPDPKQFVTNVKDVSANWTAEYDKVPDVSKDGTFPVNVVVKDESGNKAVIRSELTVVTDQEPPVIEGAKDLEVYIGDPIAYKAGITVTDNEDANPTLEVDNSKVKLNEPGDYPVIYTAKDVAGNTATAQITLHLSQKPEGYVEPEVVYELADQVLAEIITPDMTDMEKAFAICRWANMNITYTNTSNKGSWTIGAYQAFTRKTGDCYTYYAAAKAMYDRVGIANVDVVKSDTSHSSHYWSLINLGDGWYHVDSTPRKGRRLPFFMMTDAELEEYSVAHKNSHIFDKTLYPERSEVSVQDKVNYSNGTIRK